MADNITVSISGGLTEERDYVSHIVETALTAEGFNDVTNNIVPGEVTAETGPTLLDYASKANPELFKQPIEIVSLEIDDLSEADLSDGVEEANE